MTLATRAVVHIMIISALLLCSMTARADPPTDLENERAELEAERKVIEERTKLEQAKISQDYAKEKALKEIFGSSVGTAGSINIGDGKTPVILRAQVAGADAVKMLSELLCKTLASYTNGTNENKKPFLVTESQNKAMSEAKAFKETANQAHDDLIQALEKVGMPQANIMQPKAFIGGLILVPAFANAIVSVAKLFRHDYAIAPGTNENFNSLFDGYISTTATCTNALGRPVTAEVRKEAIKEVTALTKFYQVAESSLKVAEDYLKDKGSQLNEADGIVRTSAMTLRGLLATIKPSSSSSQLGAIAGAIGLSNYLGKVPRLTYKVETQQLQVLKTGTFTGTKLERSASAQAFYRLLDDAGQLTNTGYVSYSTPQDKVKLDEAESYAVSSIEPPK